MTDPTNTFSLDQLQEIVFEQCEALSQQYGWSVQDVLTLMPIALEVYLAQGEQREREVLVEKDSPALERLTLPELRERCKAQGLRGYSHSNKAELIKRIRQERKKPTVTHTHIQIGESWIV